MFQGRTILSQMQSLIFRYDLNKPEFNYAMHDEPMRVNHEISRNKESVNELSLST